MCDRNTCPRMLPEVDQAKQDASYRRKFESGLGYQTPVSFPSNFRSVRLLALPALLVRRNEGALAVGECPHANCGCRAHLLASDVEQALPLWIVGRFRMHLSQCS